MSEPTILYEKCPHDKLEEHKTCGCVGILHTHHDGKPVEWFLCPGGRERTFELVARKNKSRYNTPVQDYYEIALPKRWTMWMEVTNG